MNKIKNYITRLPKVIKWIVTINVLINIICVLFYAFADIDLITYLAAYPTYSEKFNPLTIFTSIFVHAYGLWHIIPNMVLFLIFAPFVVKKLGTKKFILSYFFIGLISYFFVNYAYHKNKKVIEKSITEIGVNVEDIKIYNGQVDENYVEKFDSNNQEIILNYNYVTSRTYGNSGCVYGIIVIYLFFNILKIRKILYLLIGGFFVLLEILVFNIDSNILDGTAYAHTGGILAGVIVTFLYKLKKGII